MSERSPGSADDRLRSYRTDALVLRRRHMGEADSVFVLYSDRKGRFEAIAKGVRRANSRKAGHLEPLSRVELQLARGRNLDIITQAQVIEAHSNVRADLDRLYAGLYVAELVESVTAEGLAHQGLYATALSALAALDAGLEPGHVSRWFEVQLLALLGHELQTSGCAGCGKPLPPAPGFLIPAMGGVVCDQCRVGAGAGREITLRAMKVLRYARTADPGAFAGVRIDDDLQDEMRRGLAAVLRQVVERDLRTAPFAAGRRSDQRTAAASAS